MKKKVFAILLIISLVIGVMPMTSINKVVAAETESQSDTCRFSGMTLELGGKIGVNFYVSSDADLAADDYAEFVLGNGGRQTVKKSEATETAYGVKFTCWVPAKEMADTITATLYKGGEIQHTVTTTVKGYAEIILQNEKYASAQKLANAMLNYGAYAQQVLKYKTDALANEGIVDAVSDVQTSQLEEFKKSKQGVTDFGSLYGTTLVLNGDTTLRMYFKFVEGASLEGLTFTIGGETQNYTQSGEYYIVDITNISAYDLNEDYTVTVTAGEKSFDASCSALTYCYNALVNSTDETLQNMAKALYLYNQAAEEYQKILTENEARIGETYYVTFEEAVSAATSSTEKPTVYLLKDVEVSAATSIASGNEFTIQSEGDELYSITCSDTTTNIFDVTGTLTLSNLELLNGSQAINVLSGGAVYAGGITISGSNGYAINNAGTFCIKSGEEVVVSKVNSRGLNNTGTVCTEEDATDATLVVNYINSNNHGIYSSAGSINVPNISVTDVQSTSNAGEGIRLKSTTLIATTVNVSDVGYDGIYLESSSTLTAETVNVSNADNQGIQLQHKNTLTVTNINISNTGANGLRLYNNSSQPTVTIGTLVVKDSGGRAIEVAKTITSDNISISEAWYKNCKNGFSRNISSGVATPQVITD